MICLHCVERRCFCHRKIETKSPVWNFVGRRESPKKTSKQTTIQTLFSFIFWVSATQPCENFAVWNFESCSITASFPGYLMWQVPKCRPRACRNSEQMEALSSMWIKLVSSEGEQRMLRPSSFPPQPVPSPVCVITILSIGKVVQDATTERFLQSVWTKLMTITAKPRSFSRWIASRFSCRIWWSPSTGYRILLLEIGCLSRTLW